MPYACPVSDFPKGSIGLFEPALHELKIVHARTIRQNFADGNRQDFSLWNQQNLAVTADVYREVLKRNVKALMKKNGVNPDTLKARYIDGTKQGKLVSARSVRNLLNIDASAPGIDIIAAIAARFGLSVWQLLAPNFDVESAPRLALTPDELKLHHDFQILRKRFRSSPDDPPDNRA